MCKCIKFLRKSMFLLNFDFRRKSKSPLLLFLSKKYYFFYFLSDNDRKMLCWNTQVINVIFVYINLISNKIYILIIKLFHFLLKKEKIILLHRIIFLIKSALYTDFIFFLNIKLYRMLKDLRKIRSKLKQLKFVI